MADTGSLADRIVEDDRYMDRRFRESIAVTSIDQAAGDLRVGSLETIQRLHFIPDSKSLHKDVHKAHRRERGAITGWGDAIPLLSQLRHVYSREVRSGAFSGVAITTKTLDNSPRDPTAPSQATVAREFLLELDRYGDVLRDTITTSATGWHLATLLTLHMELGVPLPPPVTTFDPTAPATFSSRPGTSVERHALLVTMTLHRLGFLLEERAAAAELVMTRATTGDISNGAERVSVRCDGQAVTPRSLHRFLPECRWMADVAGAVAHEGRFEELMPQLAQTVRRAATRVWAVDEHSADTQHPLGLPGTESYP